MVRPSFERQMTFVSDRTSVLFEPSPAPMGARK
jgi:hypothetical protein